MSKPKSKRRIVSLRLTATFVLAGIVISMFLVQAAAAAEPDEALWFDPFTLRVVPRRAVPRVISGIAPRIVPTGAKSADTLRATGSGSSGPILMGYVPPPRIPYRPPLRSPYRPPL